MNHLNSIQRIRTGAVLAALVLFMSLAACSDNSLLTAAKTMSGTATTVAGIQTTVINAQAQNLISVDDATVVLQICDKMNLAGKQADAIIRAQTKIPAAERSSFTAIITPLLNQVNTALAPGGVLSHVSSQTLRTDIQLALTTFQAALATTQAALGGK